MLLSRKPWEVSQSMCVRLMYTVDNDHDEDDEAPCRAGLCENKSKMLTLRDFLGSTLNVHLHDIFQLVMCT